ncbi:unnamed protein product [Arabis nemorensis]|uniref:Uncharacterized protein n=1 Tax=Arabis nemorensis TaxID=586526 RepID=A0A565AQZ7_9BRAS|nr:unnamed protein product [Arabis nemorensis]
MDRRANEVAYWSSTIANLPLGLCVGSLINVTDAEIHVYDNKRFTIIANGLYVPGGSQSLYASKFQNVGAAASPGTHSKGISFIR